MQSLHLYRSLLCGHTDRPPHSAHLCRSFLCGHTDAPPQSLHVLRCRLCGQMEPPPQSTHLVRRRPCSHTDPPTHLVHEYLTTSWTQKAPPPHALQNLRHRPCSHPEHLTHLDRGLTPWTHGPTTGDLRFEVLVVVVVARDPSSPSTAVVAFAVFFTVPPAATCKPFFRTVLMAPEECGVRRRARENLTFNNFSR